MGGVNLKEPGALRRRVRRCDRYAYVEGIMSENSSVWISRQVGSCVSFLSFHNVSMYSLSPHTTADTFIPATAFACCSCTIAEKRQKSVLLRHAELRNVYLC